jgi:hypothetical protein
MYNANENKSIAAARKAKAGDGTEAVITFGRNLLRNDAV